MRNENLKLPEGLAYTFSAIALVCGSVVMAELATDEAAKSVLQSDGVEAYIPEPQEMPTPGYSGQAPSS